MPHSRIPQELHRQIFELTLALYRVTDFFPHGEPIRKNIREKANEIFGSVTEYDHAGDFEHPDRFVGAAESEPRLGWEPRLDWREAASIIARIQAIKGYLEVARSQRFVKPINMRVLEREYDSVGSFFEREMRLAKQQEQDTKKENLVKEDPNLLPAKKTLFQSQPTKSMGSTWDEFVGEAYEEHDVSFSEDFYPVRSQTPLASADTFVYRTSNGIDSKKQSQKDITSQKMDVSKGHSAFSPLIKDINDRQKRILEYMEISPRAKISDFFSFFSEVSSKTIQRDLQDLVDKEYLIKEGDKRWTVYSIKNIR